MGIIEKCDHEKSLNKMSSDLAQAKQEKKHYRIQAFLSLGTAAILGTVSAVNLSHNLIQPSDIVVAMEATTYFSLIVAAYSKIREFDSGAKKLAIENLVDMFDHKDRNTIRYGADKIIKKDQQEHSLTGQISKLRDKILNTNDNIITDKPNIK